MVILLLTDDINDWCLSPSQNAALPLQVTMQVSRLKTMNRNGFFFFLCDQGQSQREVRGVQSNSKGVAMSTR